MNTITNPKLVPTDEQSAAIEATSSGRESLMLNAYAGTAKTTTLGMIGVKVRGPALALAFNKSIQVELAKRFAPNFEVKTMNGFGFGALVRQFPRVIKWNVEGRKIGKIISEIGKRRKIDLTQDDWENVKGLVTRAQTAGLVPGREDGLVADSPEAWQDLADDLLLSSDELDFLGEIAYEALVENNRLTEQGIISFDDQVYYPTLHGAKFPLFPTMLVDEAQDLNPLNHAMLARAMRPDGRLVVCGDPRQSIYGFRGSVSESMGALERLRPEWKHLPLTLTFRCPKVVVDRQQRHAPGFRAFHLNPDGQFRRFEFHEDLAVADEFEYNGWSWANVLGALPDPRCSIAILCRNNGPLLALAFKLLRSGIGVVMLGRDIGKGLIVLSRKIEPDNGASIVSFASKLRDWEESETSLAKANGREEKMAGIIDRAECLRAVASGAICKDVGDLRVQLEKLFSRESGQVTLGSIHRSKGLEWDFVLHLDAWRVPSRQARKAALHGNDRQLKQEWNLKYVCETRTRHTLIEANLEDFRS